MIAPATSIPLTGSGVSAHNRHRVRWTPVYGRLDKVEFRGWEAPYPEQVDGREASSILGGVQAEGGPGGRQGRSDDGPTGEPGIRTSQMTAWKKQLMAQVTELFADRQRRRANQAADELRRRVADLVEDRVVARQADLPGVPPQLPGGEPVEGAHLHRLRPDQVGHAPAHLVGGLVGEGECHDRGGGHADRDEVGHAMGDDPGLAAARPCQHQQRPLDMGGGGTLRLV